MSLLKQTIASILPLDNEAAWATDARLNSLTKPPGSLGHLEELVRRYAAIRHDESVKPGRGAIAVFVADHGVADEGVSAFPQAVTVEMLRNIAVGGAAISVLARRFGYALKVVDVGVKVDTSANPLAGVTYRRIGAGTRNFLDGPAMTPDETMRALETGIEIAGELAKSGATLIGIGEMGIANSTPAAAILCALTAIPPESIVGRGTGLDDARRAPQNRGGRTRARDSSRGVSVGRVDAGCPRRFRDRRDGRRVHRRRRMQCPGRRRRLYRDRGCCGRRENSSGTIRPSFFQPPLGRRRSCARAGTFQARPILDLDLRLGEGTGAALAMNLIDSALDLLNSMATFEGAGVSGKLQ